MDHFLRTCVLSPHRTPCATALLLLALVGCGSSSPAPAGNRQLPAALAPETSVLRLPATDGTAELLQADALTPLGWSIDRVPGIARGLGTDLAAQTAFAVDRRGRLIGLDLYAHRAVTYLTGADFTATPDGVVLALDSARRPIRFANRAPTIYRAKVERGPVALFKGPGTQVLTFSPANGSARVIGDDGEARRFTVPDGRLAVSWYGDLAVVTTDSGLVTFEPRSSAAPAYHHIRGTPITSVFSPSAHRLYVARARDDLLALNRFADFEQVARLELPGNAERLRVDRTGRWLLAQGARRDSVWVIDLARWQVTATIASGWADDLPVVTDGRTLLVREGRDVVALDLTTAQPMERARLKGGADDVFLVIPMLPRTRATKAAPVTAVAAAEPTGQPGQAAEPSAPVAPEEKRAEPAAAVYVQVSSSQNIEWARALVAQLKDGGFPAMVLGADSNAAEAGYRVVVGPYPSRDAADSIGKRLNRPYFLITPSAPDR